ncbi:hypothetical protein [Actinospica robiniae]|nr:hypothetical protein [Actinospica robiniae]
MPIRPAHGPLRTKGASSALAIAKAEDGSAPVQRTGPENASR